MKNIVLHIGYNKTGSSSIQSFCATNPQFLAGAGAFYPTSGLSGTAHYVLSKIVVGHPNVIDPGYLQLRDSLKNEIASSDLDRVVFSSEYLAMASLADVTKCAAILDDIAPGCPVQIVVYLRRHDLWFESLFNQAEKKRASLPWKMDLADFILHVLGTTSPEANYLRLLNRWSSVFGEKNILVRPMESCQLLGGSVLSDFLSTIGVNPAEAVLATVPNVNESLPMNVLYAMGMMKRCLAPGDAANITPLLLNSSAGMLPAVPENYGKMTHAQRVSLYRFFMGDYKAIASRFSGCTNPDLFQEPSSKA